MSGGEESKPRGGWSIRLFPGFWTFVFVVCAATGNCEVCGFDHNYVREVTRCES